MSPFFGYTDIPFPGKLSSKQFIIQAQGEVLELHPSAPLSLLSNRSKQSITVLILKVKFAQSWPTLCDPMACTVHGILQAKVLEQTDISFSRASFRPRSPSLQVDSFPAEPPGKPKNTEVGSLSLLQGSLPGIKPGSPALQADSLPAELPGKLVLIF